MVNTQTPVTQKCTPHGVTSMKNVVHARSKNIKLTVEWNTRGQPCNNKGGNTLVSYIGVLTPCQDNDKDCGYYVIKFMKDVITKCKAEVQFNYYTFAVELISSTTQCSTCAVEENILLTTTNEALDIFNSEVFYIRCGIYIYHNAMFYMRCGIDIFNSVNSRIRC
ncbi:hypothetical protein Lal_00031512 [Lupinus albus]|nr:hypothetical protein Lal_00031512 [Lupinus albus]